jgi:transglutaminase/protease-like cytokinesis protein 3
MALFQEKKKKEREFRYGKRKLERWKKGFNKRLLKKLIIGKESICSGYSSLLETMCGHAGITCEVISGYGRQESEKIGYGTLDHAWNAVFINSKWYLCDPTWASGYFNEDFNVYRKRFNKDYFLADPPLFALDHYPKNKDWLLLTDKLSLKDFLNSPHKSSGFIANKLNHYKPEEGQIKIKSDSAIKFAFTSNLQVDSLKSITVNAYKLARHSYRFINVEEHKPLLNQEGYYNFDLTLKDKGLFVIRIYIGRKLALTYEVVSK